MDSMGLHNNLATRTAISIIVKLCILNVVMPFRDSLCTARVINVIPARSSLNVAIRPTIDV